jgi:hypothetical protein
LRKQVPTAFTRERRSQDSHHPHCCLPHKWSSCPEIPEYPSTNSSFTHSANKLQIAEIGRPELSNSSWTCHASAYSISSSGTFHPKYQKCFSHSRKLKAHRRSYVQWHDLNTKFHTNLSSDSRVIR